MYSTLTRSIFRQGLSKYDYASGYSLTGIHQPLLNNVSSRKTSQKLPSLPVPELQKTLDKYLLSVRPHLTDEEFDCSTKIAKEFAEDEGKTLQECLQEKAKNTDNWLLEWWLKTAYLGFRNSVVVFSSPGLVFPMREFKTSDDRLMFAANMISGALAYKILIDTDKIPTDMMGKSPLDMGQYKKVFGTCRIPGVKIDTLEYYPKSKHIIVMNRNNFYKVDVFGEGNCPISVKQLFDVLQEIECDKECEEPIGILSSEHRDNWGKAYECLMKDADNQRMVKKIQSSLFLMCLDRKMPKSRACNLQTIAGEQLIHGGGFEANSANRWFDKTIQFIVSETGINGLSYEHSPAEGQPIAVMTDFIINYMQKNEGKDVPDARSLCGLEKLKFKVDCNVREAMETAKKSMKALIIDLELDCLTFDKYGKEFIKSQKLSPDSYIQMALQFAFYRLHSVPGAHYESAATRKYKDGRTETIRSCSIESICFAKKMLDSKASDQEKIKALRDAINGHKKYTMDALNGYGVDRHLLGLKLTAIESKMEIPEFYTDKGFVKSSHMRISTSQVATKCDGFMCYGPIVHDGYACCYNPRKDDINLAVAAHTSNPETSAKDFREAIVCSLLEMQELLAKNQQSKL